MTSDGQNSVAVIVPIIKSSVHLLFKGLRPTNNCIPSDLDSLLINCCLSDVRKLTRRKMANFVAFLGPVGQVECSTLWI
jgi:hypothetical protein